MTHSKTTHAIRPFILAAGIACLILAPGTDAAEVTLTATDAAGSTSFNTGTRWSDGLAPSAGNDYFVGNGITLRTPTGGTHTFQGDSLTLGAGSTFAFKTAGLITINDLILNGGTISNFDTGAESGGDLVGKIAGNLTVTAPSIIDSNGGSARSFVINSLMSGTESLTITRSNSGSGSVTFTNAANTFSGPLIVKSGAVLAVGALANGGVASHLGMSTNAASNLVLDTGTLRINGAGGSTDRLFTLNASATIESSGTGAVQFTNAGAIAHTGTGARTLTLNGTNTGDNVFNPLISDGTAVSSLTKQGQGTWIISGANTYTGNTTISNGILRITNNSALGSTGNVTIQGDVGNNGTLELSGGVTLTKTISLSARQGVTANAAHIRSVAGDNVINGTLNGSSGGSEYNLEAGAGTTLAINGNVNLSSLTGGTRNLKLMGQGSGVLNGNFIRATQSGVTTLTKMGGGTWTLNGTVGHGGATMINEGKLVLGATSTMADTNAIQIAAGASLDVTPRGGLTLNAGSTLSGRGTAIGNITSSNGTTFVPGTPTEAGTLFIDGNLSLVGGETIVANFGSATTVGNGVNDLIDVNGTLTTAGTTNILFRPVGASVGGVYQLINFDGAGTLGGTFNVLNNTRYTVAAITAAGQVNVTVSGSAADLVWAGFVDGKWDTTTSNWNEGEETFFEADRVTFDADGVFKDVQIVGTVLPGGVTVNGAEDYTFSGGAIGGGGNITKNGTGTLTLNAANSLEGNVLVNGGVLKIGNAGAFGTTKGGVTIGANGTLDVNSLTVPVGEVVTISGSGHEGKGAVVNNGEATGGLKNLVLAGDASIGGTARWDIRDVPGGLNGAGHALTKIGTNEIYLKDLGETHLGSVIISGGILGFEGNTTFGDGAGTVQVNEGASLVFYNYTATNTKTVDLKGGMLQTTEGAGANNVVTSGVTLSADSTVDTASGTTLALRGVVSGEGEFFKNGAGTLELGGTEANTNTGLTVVGAGTLRLAKPAGVNAIGGDLLLSGGSVTFANGEQIPDTATITLLGGNLLTLSNETVRNVIVDNSAAEARALNGVNVTDLVTITSGMYGQASNTSSSVGGVNMQSGILRIAANSGNSTLDVGAGGITVAGGEIQVGHGVGEWDAVLNLKGDLTVTSDLLINDGGYTGERLREINLHGARTVDVAEATTTTVHAHFGGEGSLIKAGEGTLLLTDRSLSTFTGPTAVNEGTLLVSGSLSGGVVTVAEGATLGGNGTINGNVVLNGILEPGITTGTLTLGNTDLTLGSNSLTTFELVAEGYDSIAGINNLTLDGSVRVSLFEDYVPLWGATFQLLDFTTINASGFNVASDLVLPELTGDLNWDTSKFLTDGTLAVVPEPTTAAMLLMGVGFLGARRRRK